MHGHGLDCRQKPAVRRCSCTTSMKQPNSLPELNAAYGARHASELPYVFRQLTEHGRGTPTPKDEALSEMMRTFWTNFVKTGDPNGKGLPEWPAYSDSNTQVLHIEAEKTQPGPLVNESGLEVLDEYFASRRIGEVKR